MLRSVHSTAPWDDGVHYFQAVQWRHTGHFRITFKLKSLRAAWERADPPVHVPPLVFDVRPTDPAWEADFRHVIEAEIAAAAAREEAEAHAHEADALQPLSAAER